MMRNLLLIAALVFSSPLVATSSHAQEGHGDTPAPAAAEQGAVEHGAAEHGAGEHGAAEHGAGEHGAGEHGAAEHGAAEHGAHHGEAEEGIVNWWSWDYGPSAKDPGHLGWPPPFGWALVNFGVFLFILSRILWRPMKVGMVDRHEKIKGDLDEASRLRKEAEAQLAEFTKKVANADQEVDALLALLRKEAELDRARIIASAEAEAKRLRADADRQIQIEIERARAELRKESVEAALKAAEEILRTRVTAEDQKQLAERYIGGVEKVRSTLPGTSSTGGAA